MSVPEASQNAAQLASATSTGQMAVLRPFVRPKALEQKAMARKRKRAQGSVCGDVALQGTYVGPVPGPHGACGIDDAVRLRSVSGIVLSQQAVMDCTTAKALKTWTDRSAKPAMKRLGGLAAFRVAAHYTCRTRNNQPGARVSEHGKGRAIDISGFQLKNGQVISVLEGWNAPRHGDALRKMHAGACGPFGTVLGPDADRHHRDHFHFDTARYRSGSYCR
ncbi:extensin-like domain-containing protein [Pseudosulfitobacter koreensis]|uniref:Extensin family protein n=1 Tax=Pseudosulfitobacter koreensis TaxID=2968472 RepID=A0ABT1YZ13_9RHOB|nr:extensin family protein [Pseudosulfitobacter koreense]